MTKSAYGENPTEMKITRLINCTGKISYRRPNAYTAVAISFGQNKKPTKHQKNIGNSLIEIEENCDFPNTGIKPADLLISKFITSITKDEKLRDKVSERKKHDNTPQLNEFYDKTHTTKRHGKNLIPKQLIGNTSKNEPIQKVFQNRDKKEQKLLLLLSTELDETEHILPGKKKLYATNAKRKDTLGSACKSKIQHVS